MSYALSGRHFLKLLDFTSEEIVGLVDLAQDLKEKKHAGIPHRYLEGKNMVLIFEKTSTRTRCSFEVAGHDLGMGVTYLDPSGSQIGNKESIKDTARVLSRYLDGIMIRTFDQKEVEALAEFGTIPIINGLTDYCHPCQVLADLMTIREYKGTFRGRKLCYIGDGNNMTNSLIVGGIKLGMKVSVACPKGYEPDAAIMEWARKEGNFECDEDVLKMAADSDVLYTDVWASMGQEAEAEQRKKVFKQYQINDEVMKVAKSDAMVLHCLPAHREEEITAKVFEEHSKEIFDEAENRLHAQKAVLVKCLR